MTHALHRVGTRENLSGDFTVVVRPERGINAKGSITKTREILRILHDIGALNITSARGKKYKGNIYQASIENIIEDFGDGASIYACIDNEDTLVRFLQRMIEGDYGLSVVVQGVCEDVKQVLKKVGLEPHTYNHSIGVWGKTEKLPSRNILEITTMCGHGMISPYLVMDIIEKVRKGIITPREGAIKLAEPCVCGIFNLTRAEKLIRKMCDSP